MHRYHRSKVLAAASAIAVITSVAGALPAAAKDGDVIRRGSCSAAADWKFKAGQEDNGIEIELELDSNVVGQRWNWRIRHEGDSAASGTARTTARSGSFEVTRVLGGHAGADHFSFRANNPATGDTCRGTLTF